jgi:hypothetical protein
MKIIELVKAIKYAGIKVYFFTNNIQSFFNSLKSVNRK